MEMRNLFQENLEDLNRATSTDQPRASALIRSVGTNRGLIYSSTAWGKFFQNIAGANGDSAAAYAYFKGDGLRDVIGSRSGFNGVLAASLFANPKFVFGAQDAEVQAFAEQRDKIDAFRADVAAEFRTIKADADLWKASTQKQAADLVTKNGENFKGQLDAFNASVAGWEKKIRDLETTYTEKIRLEKPAKYWADLEDRYIKQGRWWIGGSVSIVLALAIWVGVIVYPPPGMLTLEQFTFGGLKGAVLIGVSISAFLYLMSLFVKVATSSYHLARDARERHQLTHVFLALISEKAIEAKDREDVLSALFSRSDTGLLKR